MTLRNAGFTEPPETTYPKADRPPVQAEHRRPSSKGTTWSIAPLTRSEHSKGDRQRRNESKELEEVSVHGRLLEVTKCSTGTRHVFCLLRQGRAHRKGLGSILEEESSPGFWGRFLLFGLRLLFPCRGREEREGSSRIR